MNGKEKKLFLLFVEDRGLSTFCMKCYKVGRPEIQARHVNLT